MTCRKSEAPTVRFIMFTLITLVHAFIHTHIGRNAHELRVSQGKSPKRTGEIDKDAKANLPNDERSAKIRD